MKLTTDQVLQIPKLIETKNQKEIAEMFGVNTQTIVYWIRRLKKDGVPIKPKLGRRPLKLK